MDQTAIEANMVDSDEAKSVYTMELISSSNEDDVLEDEDSVEERVIDIDSNASSEAKNKQSKSGSSENDGEDS